jgi:hypothetical protein
MRETRQRALSRGWFSAIMKKKYALKKGFYVIEPSGNTFKITVPEDSPHEW